MSIRRPFLPTCRRMLLAAGLCCLAAAAGAQNLRVVTYNIAADIDGYTTPRPGLYAALEAVGQQIYGGNQQPIDVLALQETTSNVETITPIVDALNAYYGAGVYAMAGYQGTQRGGATYGNGPSALVYNTRTVSLALQNGADGAGVPGTPSSSGGAARQVTRYKLQPLGTPAAAFYVYVSHMKSSYSGTAASNEAARNREAQLIVADIARLPAGSSVLGVGDFNLSGSYEDAYQTLVATGPFIDPLNYPRDDGIVWNSSAYKQIMTESATSLRYRDDIQFMTANVYAGTALAGLRYVAGSCRAFGNNGTTNVYGSINSSSNSALKTNFSGPITSAMALSALASGSDHLPVVVDYSVVTPFITWQAQHFAPGESSLAGDNADPDGDGIANLLEYAFNLDPRLPGAQGLPAVGQTTVNAKTYLTVIYTRVIANTDITYVPQISDDLVTWQSGSNYLADVSSTSNPDGITQTVTVRDAATVDGSAGGKRFLRLLITRP